MKAVSDAVDVQMKVNNFITVSHFAIALASTISQLLYLFTPYSTDYDIKQLRILAVVYFLAGMADLVLSLLLWLVFDDDEAVIAVADGGRVYDVKDIIKQRNSGINCEEEDDEDEISVRDSVYSFTSLSKRMIDQFFTEVEGPDRDWEDKDYDFLFGENSTQEELILDSNTEAYW